MLFRSERIDDCSRRVTQYVGRRMQQERFAVQRLEQRLSSAVVLRTTREANRLEQCSARLSHAASARLMYERNRMAMLSDRLPLLAAGAMERARHRLAMLGQRVEAVNPVNILRRGYSITMFEGKAVTDSRRLSAGDEVTIMLASGKVGAVVKE